METLYQIAVVISLAAIIVGIYKGFGDNRTIVVFRNYDDLGLTFLIPVSLFLCSFVLTYLGVNKTIALIFAGCVALWLLAILTRNTYADNGNHPGKTALALFTKLPLAFIWVFNLIQMLNPGGRTAAQRAQSRGSAILVLTLLTPVIGFLVVDKTGSFFNPKQWISGRRVGPGIRSHL